MTPVLWCATHGTFVGLDDLAEHLTLRPVECCRVLDPLDGLPVAEEVAS